MVLDVQINYYENKIVLWKVLINPYFHKLLFFTFWDCVFIYYDYFILNSSHEKLKWFIEVKKYHLFNS